MEWLWTDKQVLRLIDYYRERPVLWDPTDEFYKTNLRKNEAWVEIAHCLDNQVDVGELRRKMASVLASYRRERLRELQGKTSRWFGYNALEFLRDIYKPKAAIFKMENVNEDFDEDIQISPDLGENMEEDEYSDINVQKWSPSEPDLEENETEFHNGSQTQDHAQNQFIKKRKLQYPRVNKTRNIVKPNPIQTPKDHFDLFGEYVAEKLRTFDKVSCAHAQKAIANVLFDAEMGNFTTNPQDPLRSS